MDVRGGEWRMKRKSGATLVKLTCLKHGLRCDTHVVVVVVFVVNHKFPPPTPPIPIKARDTLVMIMM